MPPSGQAQNYSQAWSPSREVIVVSGLSTLSLSEATENQCKRPNSVDLRSYWSREVPCACVQCFCVLGIVLVLCSVTSCGVVFCCIVLSWVVFCCAMCCVMLCVHVLCCVMPNICLFRISVIYGFIQDKNTGQNNLNDFLNTLIKGQSEYRIRTPGPST